MTARRRWRGRRIPFVLALLGLLLPSAGSAAPASEAVAGRMHAQLLQALGQAEGGPSAPESAAERALRQQLSLDLDTMKAREPAIQCKSGDGDVCTCTTGCWATADRCACA